MERIVRVHLVHTHPVSPINKLTASVKFVLKKKKKKNKDGAPFKII